jgi:hypothetical protein
MGEIEMNKELFSWRNKPKKARKPKDVRKVAPDPKAACSGKIKLSECEAKAEARISSHRHLTLGTPVLSAYKCPFCHSWHVGTDSKKRNFWNTDWTTL